MKYTFYILPLGICMISCNKNIVDDYPSEGGCEKFAGKYLMYDPQNDSSYFMIIGCKPREINTQKDTLTIMNYANKFNFKHGTGPALNDPGHMSGIYYIQIKNGEFEEIQKIVVQ